MAEISILRFPILGKENEYFLLEVSSNGSRPLDLKLVGSESTAVFVTKLRHKRVGDYKAQNDHCSPEEWEEILTSTLINRDPVSDLEIKADLQTDGESVSLSFRKNIQGITQRLGTITLEENEKTEISPFDWCVSAIGAREKVQENLVTTIAKVQTAEDSLKELKDQLNELIKIKEEDETELLEKFRDLLNEKKVKIRQQQRLLASASVDPDKLANIGGGRKNEKHVAQVSRASKRKIKEEPESSDAEFEKMDVEEDNDDGSAQLDIEEDHGDTTADETASGTGTDDEPAPPPARSRRTQAAVPKRNARASTSAKATHKLSSSGEDSEEPPPRRVLPFMKSKQPAAPVRKPADDDETESEEEL
ncbi:uncharacterized protein GGS22DRAFT_146785 [Annulohypoxylon maeteangense]|uniref:uncharacterized protein n=1 Tax=Annulohypoxylon maeteangense TaxID=1927788 RepID=UPI00200849F4|nr:uncharacterized protein GGS22DRAFT_146785 [Annulohypoxylon maeteangense]KAI0884780.1 hypothetical protein GGS22DRAFT_146785 [Annulohypoxylon maeteangense]